jgi:hypothetical protein
MNNDIPIPEVTGVKIAIVFDIELETLIEDWYVYLINTNSFSLTNAIIVSRGYGIEENAEVKTATLRHFYELVEPNSWVQVERIVPETFHLVNEFWLSYYEAGNDVILDKKVLFMPQSISHENLIYIPEVGKQGILHT